LAHHKFLQKIKKKRLPKIKVYIGRWGALLWPKYVGEKGGFLGKTYGIKMFNILWIKDLQSNGVKLL
jgi:hypothetical protein